MDLDLEKLSVNVGELRLQPSLNRRLQVLMSRLNLSRAHLIRQAIVAGLPELEKQAAAKGKA